MRTAFSIEEWVSAETYTVARSGSTPWRTVPPPLERCSAASRATRLAPELESWITPPPVPVERNEAGSPRSSANQSRTCCSSSVAAGLVTQDIPWTPRPAETRSPRTEGPEVLAGK
jgi:hypothetical protein